MWRAGLLALLLVAPAWAEAPARSPRPMPRPGISVADVSPAVQIALDAAVQTSAAAPVETRAAGVAKSPRPLPRPQTAAAPAAPVAGAAAAAPAPAPPKRRGLFGGLFGKRDAPADEAPARTSGYVCGDRDIVGVQLADIGSSTNGCGVDDPVQVSMVAGISLSQAATMDCNTALALKRWINEGVRPTFGKDKVVQFQVAAHYICRSRNNVRGAKISEHGRGRAIDISAFVLASGKVLTVASNFGRQIRAAYKAACGIFGTTLGPGSDGYHEDHIHLDTANHGNGPYCR